MTRLVAMDRTTLRAYLDRLVRSYAEEHIRTGRWTREEGLGEARREVDRILPEGVDTPNQFFFDILDGPGGTKVGSLWLALEPRGAFVYDLEVLEPYRRHGHAEAAMRLAEAVAREKGAAKIALHVFGDNLGARRLYTKLGYAETNVMMAKSLDR